MNRLATTKLSSKGQIVIPEEIREQLHLQVGCVVIWHEAGHKARFLCVSLLTYDVYAPLRYAKKTRFLTHPR